MLNHVEPRVWAVSVSQRHPNVNLTSRTCLRPRDQTRTLFDLARISLGQSQGNNTEECRMTWPADHAAWWFQHTQVASKKLDDGAWFLLESPVVCWPLMQQEGGWPGCVDFLSRFHSTYSTCSKHDVLIFEWLCFKEATSVFAYLLKIGWVTHEKKFEKCLNYFLWC